MSGDWLKLHRSIRNSRVFSDESAFRLFMLCLLRANYTPGYFKGHLVNPGQFACSIRTIAEELEWSLGKTHRMMQKLVDFGCIDKIVEHHFTLVTICNWGTYQNGKSDSGTKVEQEWNKSGTKREQIEEEQEKQEEQETTSLSDGKDKSKKPKAPPFDPLAVPLPYSSPEFIEAWSDWVAHRNEIKKPLSPTMVKKQTKVFAEMGEARSIDMIEHTVANGWQGLRESDKPKPPPKMTDVEIYRAAGFEVINPEAFST